MRQALGAELIEVDLAPFLAAAELLYAGPWVAERTAAVGEFLAARPDAFWPTTRAVIETGRRFSAVDAFTGQYRLAELARAAAAVWEKVDVLLLPTTPTIYRVDELAAEPILLNSRLGTYTNFVNLLDLCALALPAGFRPDGLPLGITLMAPAWQRPDAGGSRPGLAARRPACRWAPPGATLPDEPDRRPAGAHEVELAVVGAHLSGGPLNHELFERRCPAAAHDAHRRLLPALRAGRHAAAQAGHGARPWRGRGRDRGRGLGAAACRHSARWWRASRRRWRSAPSSWPTAAGSRASCARTMRSTRPATSPRFGGWRAYLGSVAATTRDRTA